MNNENKQYLSTEREPSKGKKILVRALGGTAALIAVTVGGHEIGQALAPEMHGEQTVMVEPGDTVDGLVNEYVDGGASNTGAVRTEVMSDPENADVFENDQLDPGETVTLPQKVE